jgi:tetratricopeptide (TPR) repeat protein
MEDTIDTTKLMAQFKESAKYVEDILNGKTTIATAAGLPDQDLEKLFTRARNALQVEDFPKAEELFTTLLFLNNKDTRAAMGLAGALEGQGRYEFALPLYFLVLATTPYDPVAPFRGGICFMHLGKKEEAVKFFSLAADCKDETAHPGKLVYIEKAKGMLKALSNN